MMECVTRKATSLFKPIDRVRLFQAVDRCHDVLSEATHLLKAYYLYKFNASKHPLSPEETICVDETLLDTCCLVVAGDKLQVRQVKEKPPKTTDPDKLEAGAARRAASASDKLRKQALYKELTQV